MDTSLSIKSATKIIRKLRLHNDDVLMIKADTVMAEKENMDALATAIGRGGLEGIIVVVVDEFSDLAALNQSIMQEHGWFKFDSAAAAIMDRLIKDKNDQKEKDN